MVKPQKKKPSPPAPDTAAAPPPGAGKPFWPSTHLSWIEAARGGGGEAARHQALEDIAVRYRQPILSRIQAEAPELAREDVEDICQQFFHAEIMGEGRQGKGLLDRFDRDKGRLRTYLATALRNFLSGWHRSRKRQKRGGRETHLPLEAAEQIPAPELPPDRVFDLLWSLNILSAAFAEVEREWLADPKKAAIYAVLRPYLVGQEQEGRLAGQARTLDMSSDALRQKLHRLRKQQRQAVNHAIARTVAHPAQIEDELRCLCEILRR